LDERDRAFISHLVQGVLRWRLRLDWIVDQASDFPLEKIAPPVLNILRLALYQIYFLDRVPESAAVNEAVKQAKKGYARHVVSFVNGILRAICREKDRIPFPDQNRDPVLYLSLFYSYPEWMVKKWLKEWDLEFTTSLLSAGNRTPILTIRTNTLKLSRSELIRRLGEEGIKGNPTSYSPEGVLLDDFRGKVDQLVSFREGLFQVQDEAAQITSLLLAPEPGENVLDVCGGYGGKTTHMAALMKDRGRIVALDINRRRLIGLGNSCDRLGIRSIRSVAADASTNLSSLLRKRFHRVMVDAPCSGLGVISRHPDGKWRKSAEGIDRLARLQERILDEAASLLRKGGRMLYVACTISKEENEGVVRNFLDHHKDISSADLREYVPEWGLDLIDDRGFLRTFPHIHHMDGFFAALFTKIK
jgi:16S rRNA (cytosine967-C5)-methyltransferase